MISRRSLFGLTFGGAVATTLPASAEKRQTENAVAAEPTTVPPIRVTFGPHGHACKVEINGVDVSSMCQRAHISAAAGGVTKLHLEMLVLKGSELVVEPGHVDLSVRCLERRLRFEFDGARVKADV